VSQYISLHDKWMFVERVMRKKHLPWQLTPKLRPKSMYPALTTIFPVLILSRPRACIW
jgi:hypothetical protein